MTSTLSTVDKETSAILPEEFERRLNFAQSKAQTLARIVEAQHLYTDIQGRKHLHVEAWVTIAEGYGYEIDIEWTHPLPDGGYEARAVIKDFTGQAIGHGEAECGSEGDGQWVSRPNFQQRSMAQTRAISKAARNRLAWVVVLAGYSPTPSEEMPTDRADKSQHWCEEHQANWFRRGKMRNFAHPVGDTKEWCNEPAAAPSSSSGQAETKEPSGESPESGLTVAQLRAALEAEGMPWGQFEMQVLRTTWATFLKTKGATPAVALHRWETWKQAHPAGATAAPTSPAGAGAVRMPSPGPEGPQIEP